MKCLVQEHNMMTRPGLEPGPLDPESSAPTTRPHVSHTHLNNVSYVIFIFYCSCFHRIGQLFETFDSMKTETDQNMIDNQEYLG